MLGRFLTMALFAAIGGGATIYASKKLDKGWKVPETVTFGGKSYDVPLIGGAEFDAGWSTGLLGFVFMGFGMPTAGLGLLAGTIGAQTPNVVASTPRGLALLSSPDSGAVAGKRGLRERPRVSEKAVLAILDRLAPTTKPAETAV